MILGTGIDMTDIRRIESALGEFGERFEARLFTSKERAKAHSRKEAGAQAIAATYAKRFAAKEACAKALGTGMRQNISWHDIEVGNNTLEKPSITLSGAAAKRLATLAAGRQTHIHLSLSDEFPYVIAQVIIEAE